MVGVDPECAQPYRSEFLVANGDGVLRAPMLVSLQSGDKEVDVRLEGRLEGLVPVHDVGEDWERVCVQGIQARPKHVAESTFVHEYGHLRVAHGELAAILNIAILHGI